MFKKLRIKFIAITMVMVAIVMAFAFTVVCGVEYQRSYSVVQTALGDAINEAIESTGKMKFRQGMVPPGARQDGSSSSSEAEASQAGGSSSSEEQQASSQIKPSQAFAIEVQNDQGTPNGDWNPNADAGGNDQRSRGGQKGRDPDAQPTTMPDGGQDEAGGAGQEGARAADAAPSGADSNSNLDSNSDAPDGDDSISEEASDKAGESASSSSSALNTQSTADGETQDASEGDGAFARNLGRQPDQDRPVLADEGGQDSVTINDEDMSQAAPPSIGNRPGQQRAISSLVPVAVYRVDSNDTMRVIPEITTASISADVLQEAADLAMQAEEGFGTLDSLGLHYDKASKDGTTFLAFADTSYTDAWKTLALILTGTGIGTLAVFFVVALFYSRWALRPVKEAWDSQRQFVADASHDLKTPLTVILANAAILLKHPDHTIASESQWIESTQKEAEDMQGLVNEMLELAQIEAGQQVDAVREPIDLSDLVDGETLLFDSVALERNCAFNCSIEEGITMLGDEKRVKKLVSTLIENAFKYVDESGVIDVVMRKTGKVATIDIHNTGSTISPEDLPHIFDRFYRTDKARTSGTGGFGLGLAIAREIALKHGGDITCKSTEADGTTFTITLPVAQ